MRRSAYPSAFTNLISRSLRGFLFIVSLLGPGLNPALAEEIRGAGSTAAARLYQVWGESFKTTGNQLKYDAIGSSSGLKAVIEGTVDFGASDVALSPERAQKDDLVCIPTAIAGIVPALNVAGLPQGRLRLTGPLLAAIYTGKVSKWNDEAIRKLNPGLNLPAEAIRVIAREDGSGTTHVISQYLTAVSPEWKQSMGNDFLLKWPASTLLAKGSGGVAKLIKQTPFSIGYLEAGTIQSEQINYALVANKAGQYVQPNADSFSAALSGSRWSFEGRFEDSLNNNDDKKAWPITTGTFVIMKRSVASPKRIAIVLNFLSGAFMQADKLVPASGYVALPLQTQARAVKTLASLKETNGVPIFFDVMWRPANKS